ncbi:MAG: hypothetical protein H5T50_05360 [Nitrososphaeria archaeon]|nr:hypothetical protein [Nitrososphaeria archaeon]
MIKGSFQINVEMSFFVHATEDKQKLFDKIKLIFNLSSETFKENVFEGHYGNPIIKYTIYLKGSLAKHVLKLIFKNLDPVDKNLLLESIEKRIDEHKNLYLRVEKSGLFKNFFKLDGSNVIHFKLSPKNKNVKNVKDFYKNFIMELEQE